MTGRMISFDLVHFMTVRMEYSSPYGMFYFGQKSRTSDFQLLNEHEQECGVRFNVGQYFIMNFVVIRDTRTTRGLKCKVTGRVCGPFI
ncbi:hypothetical protein C0J52_10819 [Blattella germanica]|nr:hypothetical protein C0J52_10819 [Blattella germanica]